MDEKKKILLGEKDIIAKNNEDIFINLNLNTTFSEIRKDRFDNVFDVSKQFDRERNASRDFRIYGTVDSITSNSDALDIYLFSAFTDFVDLFQASKTSSLVYSEVNAFGKKRGKYLFELNNYPSDMAYIFIPTDNLTYDDQLFVQQLVFKDGEGNFVDYGTQTEDIDEEGNSIIIDNDFYFLYNKHWVKKDLLIVKSGQTITPPPTPPTPPTPVIHKVSFEKSSDLVKKPVTLTVKISLDVNSTLGNESVTIIKKPTSTAILGVHYVESNVIPYTINWAIGDKDKFITFDDIIVFGQSKVLELQISNLVNVNPGAILDMDILVAS